MSCGCNEDPIIIDQKLPKGDQGFNGWSPMLAIVSDGARRVLQIAGWTGGTGTEPSFTNQYIGASGIVEDIADAVDIRGAIGITGAAGAAGEKGWSPILAVVTDSARRVLQIVDWTGGAGTKPSTTNQFIGAVGIVSSAAAAVDIRGATGPTGAAGTTLPSQTGNSGKFLTTDGSSLSWAALPSQFPAITSSTRRLLREKNDGTGVEFYSPFSAYVNIPMVANGIFNSTTSFITLRNSGSTVFLKTALPNDGAIRKLFISASVSVSSVSGDGTNCVGHFAIRDISNNTTFTDEQIETAYRKNPCFQYIGTFTCAGQEIGIQFKNEVSQNASVFIGGHISFIEIP